MTLAVSQTSCVSGQENLAEVRLKMNATDVGEVLHLGLMTKVCDKGLTLRAITETQATFFIMSGTCE